MSSLRKLVDIEGILALSCSADGELVAVNDDRGRVRFLASSGETKWLPLEFSSDDVRAVLLHPDGRRVCVLIGDVHPVVRILDPRTGLSLTTLDPGSTFPAGDQPEGDEDDADDDDDDDDPDEATGDEPGDREAPEQALRRLHASILEHRPPLLSRWPLEIVNNREHHLSWWPAEPDAEGTDSLLWPERLSRLALHPNHRWLAVLDRGCFVIDLESGDVISRVERQLELASLLADGEGVHTLAIDDRGALLVARTGISGNPFLAVDRFDPATGEQRSTTENWQQTWFGTFEVHIYDPTTILLPTRIPTGEYAIVYRRISLELWSSAGLQRTYPLQPSTCVIPSFDPGNFCAAARALLIDDDELALLDLISGARTPCRPRAASGELLRPAQLRAIEFVPGRAELLLWTDTELLVSAHGGDPWSRCPLPDGQRPKRWVFAAGSPERLRVILSCDARDGLWMAELDIEPSLAASPHRSLERLEAEALANPDSSEAFAVWADALSERGDPRGELILLHLQGAETEALALVQRNACVQLAGLRSLPPTSYELEWRLGFVRRALFRIENREQLAEVLCFLGTDFARLLESLEIRFSDAMDDRFRLELQVQLIGYLHAAARWPLLRSPPRLT